MLKKFLLLVVVLLGLAPLQAQSAPPEPLLWKVTQGQRVMYLLGSMHALKAEDYPLAPSVYAALKDAQQVYFELSPESMSDPEQIAYMMRAGVQPPGRTLQQSLQPATWQALQAYTQRNGVPIAGLQGLQPWMAATVVMATQLKGDGFDASMGLDEHLRSKALELGKKVLGLETLREQISIFAGWDAAVQDQFLADALADSSEDSTELQRLYQHWRTGDADGLAQDFLDGMRANTPLIYEQLLVQRNRAWLNELERFLSSPGTGRALVVVGAGHLVGQDGLVQLLQANATSQTAQPPQAAKPTRRVVRLR